MTGIRRLVLDVLIPINLPTTDLTKRLASLEGVEVVDLAIHEVERKVVNGKITIEGDEMDFEAIRQLLDTTGISLQNVDRVTCGERLIG